MTQDLDKKSPVKNSQNDLISDLNLDSLLDIADIEQTQIVQTSKNLQQENLHSQIDFIEQEQKVDKSSSKSQRPQKVGFNPFGDLGYLQQNKRKQVNSSTKSVRGSPFTQQTVVTSVVEDDFFNSVNDILSTDILEDLFGADDEPVHQPSKLESNPLERFREYEQSRQSIGQLNEYELKALQMNTNIDSVYQDGYGRKTTGYVDSYQQLTQVEPNYTNFFNNSLTSFDSVKNLVASLNDNLKQNFSNIKLTAIATKITLNNLGTSYFVTLADSKEDSQQGYNKSISNINYLDAVLWCSRINDDFLSYAKVKSKEEFNKEFKADSKLDIYGELSYYGPLRRLNLNIKRVRIHDIEENLFKHVSQKIEQMGWNDPKYKQAIPKYPKAVALITSSESAGAGREDFLRTCKAHTPWLPIYIYVTKLQGKDAEKDIVKSIKQANKDNLADVIVIARGGGASEDMFVFNTEEVVEAIVNSKLPVLTGIGHSIDQCCANMVADAFANTPTEAAYKIITHYLNFKDNFAKEIAEFNNQVDEYIYKSKFWLSTLHKDLLNHNPSGYLSNLKSSINLQVNIFKANSQSFIDNHLLNQQLLTGSWKNFWLSFEKQIQQQRINLNKSDLVSLNDLSKKWLEHWASTFASMHDKLESNAKDFIWLRDNELKLLKQQFELTSPFNPLQNGYALVLDSNKKAISQVSNLQLGSKYYLQFAQGHIEFEVLKKDEEHNLIED